MRKIRFRYIKENGQSTSVTVRCSVKRNASLISEALRHYQRVERQEIRDKQRSTDKQNLIRTFDPIALRRKQCSSTLIEEEIPLEQTSFSSSYSFTATSSSSSASSSTTTELESIRIHRDQRSMIIGQFIRTEWIYSEQLRSLIEVFWKSMHRRSDLFSEKQLQRLLGNIDQIFDFQQTFFHIFQRTVEETQPEEILISRCFLRYKDQWKLYRHYALHYPLSLIELNQLEKDRLYQTFFQTCQSRSEWTLTELLHLPLQRVNQYASHLTELFKSTPSTHPDYHLLPQAIDLFLFDQDDEKKKLYLNQSHF